MKSKLKSLFFLAIFSLLPGSSVFAKNEICKTLLSPEVLSEYPGENAQFSHGDQKVLTVGLAADLSTHDFLLVSSTDHASPELVIDPFKNQAYPGVKVKISERGTHAVFVPPSRYRSHPVVYEVRTGTFWHLKEFAGVEDLAFSSHFIYGKLPDGSLGIRDLESGNTRRLSLFKGEWQTQRLGQSESILMAPERGALRIVNLSTGKVKKILLPFRPARIQSATDGKFVLFVSGTKRAPYLFRASDSTLQRVALENAKQIELHPGGAYITFVDKGDPSILKAIEVSRLSEAEAEFVVSRSYGLGLMGSRMGDALAYRGTDGSLSLIQLSSKLKMAFPTTVRTQIIDFSFLDREVFVQSSVGDRFYDSLWDLKSGKVSTYEIPFKNKPVFSADRKKILFYFPDEASFKGGAYLVYDLKTLSVATESGRMPRSEIQDYFTALTEPGALNMAEHSSAVYFFFESGLFKKHKDLTQKILLNVLSESIGMFEEIVARYPEFAREGNIFRPNLVYEVPAIWKKAIQNYLNYFLIARATKESVVDGIKYLKAIRNYFGNQSTGFLNTCADTVSEALAEAAMEQFPEVYKSMLFKFTGQVGYPLFWFTYTPVTDLLTLRKASGILEPIIFGSAAIDGDLSTGTRYGIYAKRLPALQVPLDSSVGTLIWKQKQVKWTHEGKNFLAKVDVERVAKSANAFIPHSTAPHYQNYIGNKGSFRGMVVVASNFAAESKSTIESYEKVFKKLGYRWDVHFHITDDLKSVIKEKIATGEINYFIHEGHSDGDDRDLFRIYQHAKIIKASRKTESGLPDELYIAFPTGRLGEYTDPKKTVIFSQQEMGETIRDRVAAGNGEIVYFATSCWSVAKAANFMVSTHQKELLLIPSTMPVSVFEDDPNNVEYQMLHDFLAGKAFDEWEKDMRRNADYAHGTGNTFILRNSLEYQKMLREVLEPPVDIRIALTRNGKPYAHDE